MPCHRFWEGNYSDFYIIKSNEVICPRCNENCLIKIKDYKVILYNCKDNHETILSMNEYEETQKINLSNIKCNKFNTKNKGNTLIMNL